MTIIRREDLTAAEMKAITDRYAPYHRFEWFWDGYYAYRGETGRYCCPHDYHSVPGRAWHHGANAALHVRMERKLPARDMYEQDDRDGEKMHEGLQAAIAEMRKNGTLPKRALRPAEPRGFMQGVVRDNRAPTGRPGMIPDSQQPTGGGGPANVPGSGTGWARETPLGPPPGIHWVDAQLIADDVKQRSKDKP
jgi:hypothetical protein